MTANRLFRTARGLDIGGVKIYYGLGTPAEQTDLPPAQEIQGAFYFDGLTGVTWFNNSGVWTIAGGGSAEYVRFDNSIAQLVGSPAIETVQAAIEALAAMIAALNIPQNASDIAYDNTGSNLPGSPAPANVQIALEVMDSLVDDLIARVLALESTPPGSSTAATTSYDNSTSQIPGSPAIVNVQVAIEALWEAIQQGGGGGAPAANWELKTTNFTIAKGGYYVVDTSAGPIVATLPAFAQLDQTFIAYIKDAKGTFDVNALTVQVADLTSPYEYTVLGVASVDVDYAYADLTLGYDVTNTNVLL